MQGIRYAADITLGKICFIAEGHNLKKIMCVLRASPLKTVNLHMAVMDAFTVFVEDFCSNFSHSYTMMRGRTIKTEG